MSRWVTIICGLLGWALLVFLCVDHKSADIEAKLSQGIRQAVGSSDVRGLTLDKDGRDFILKGQVRSESKAREIVDRARVYGVRRLHQQFEVIPLKPLDLEVEAWKLGDRVLLRGELPDQDAYERVHHHATSVFGQGRVLNELKVRDASPMPQLELALKAAVEQFPNLIGAWARATGTSLHLEGRVQAENGQSEFEEKIRSEVGPTVQTGLSLSDPWQPEDLRGLARREGPSLILAGVVPDGDTWRLLDRQSRRIFGTQRVQNRLKVAELPAIFPLGSCLAGSFSVLRNLENGQTVSTPEQTLVTGLTPRKNEIEALQRSLEKNLPEDCGLVSDIAELIDSSTCEDQIRLLLAGEQIRFESGSDTIQEESDGLLQTIASTLRQCPGGNLTIEGHTDDQGDDNLNLDLSQARAEAVRKRLIQLGLPPGGAVALGFGEGHPIADNTSDEGRAKNRRIEFRIAGD